MSDTDPRVYVDRSGEGAYVVLTPKNNIVTIHRSIHEAAKAAAGLELSVGFVMWDGYVVHDPSSDEFYPAGDDARYDGKGRTDSHG